MSIEEQELFWDSMALGNSDAGVIDPADKKNFKNNYICQLRNYYFFKEAEEPSVNTLILDFGCGTGLVTEALSSKGHKTVGVDISEKLLAYGKSVRPHLNLFKIDGKNLPFDDDSFNRIMVYVVFNYVDDDQALAELFVEMKRVLKLGGKIVAIEQTVKHRTVIESEHKTMRTRHDYSHLFESCDFVVQKQKTVRFGRFPTTYFIRYGWVSKRLWNALRQFEEVVGFFLPSSRFTYTDTLFVAVKERI